ncbi:MAG TPA: lamin tail domain-containing protein [Candidatus Saccharimonadales bacterium]|nr:lamin tail domain-containing protein [Candidatus Saccharimonadales bacterium]
MQVFPTLAASATTAASSQLTSPIIITEMQPGSVASASQEFIELYNQSASAIDLSAGGWQLQIASAAATDWQKAKAISLKGVFYPGTYYLLASSFVAAGDTKSYLQDYASTQFASGLSAASGHIRVVNMASLASSNSTEDALEWSTEGNANTLISPSISGVQVTLLDAIEPGSSIKRHVDTVGVFATGDAPDAFLVSSCPSPTADNVVSQDTNAVELLAEPVSTTVDIINQSCQPPGDDGGDGTTGIQPPTSTPPAILLPGGQPVGTPGSTVPRVPLSDVGLEAPQITEILPNPAAPQTDANDEFIELYNGNNQDYDLTGFALSADSKQYVFPAGTMLQAQSFMAWYSRDTHLGLVNSGGLASLFDPFGNTISQTGQYGTAKDGQAWALANGTWQWTDVATPGTENVIHMATSAVKASANTVTQKIITAKKTVAAAAKTTKATKTVTGKPSKQASSKTQAPTMQNAADVSKTPLHVQAIALIGACALLYGAYEYRRDMANRFYQFRANRAARRTLRKSDKGG